MNWSKIVLGYKCIEYSVVNLCSLCFRVLSWCFFLLQTLTVPGCKTYDEYQWLYLLIIIRRLFILWSLPYKTFCDGIRDTFELLKNVLSIHRHLCSEHLLLKKISLRDNWMKWIYFVILSVFCNYMFVVLLLRGCCSIVLGSFGWPIVFFCVDVSFHQSYIFHLCRGTLLPCNFLQLMSRISSNLFLLAGKKSDYFRKDKLSTFHDQCLSGTCSFCDDFTLLWLFLLTASAMLSDFLLPSEI